MENPNEDGRPGWLKHLQENSWEAEILISGGAIFSLIQLGDRVGDITIYLKDALTFPGMNVMLVFLLLGINGITSGFILHLVLRGYWIGLLCLNYAFPKGINFNSLKITGPYLKEGQSFNFLNQILKLDRISGLVFFLSLSFILIVLGFTFFGFTTFSLLLAFNLPETIFVVLTTVFLVDITSNGILRRNKVIGILYRPFYVYINYLSLAFIYRPWLQVLFSNIDRWKATVAGILFIATTILLTITSASRPLNFENILDSRMLNFKFNQTRWSDTFYENRVYENERILYASIQSDMIQENYVRLFIPYRYSDDEVIQEMGAHSFQEIFVIKINDQQVQTDWFAGIRHKSKQKGITCFLAVSNLPEGKHTLSILRKDQKEKFPFPLSIPFWK